MFGISFNRKKGQLLWLVKANDDAISWCDCETGIVGVTGQLDCPWCGCGWLFSCVKCRKAFTFARAVRIDMSIEEIANLDIKGYGMDPTAESVNDWKEEMTDFLTDIEEGIEYCYLDGYAIPKNAKDLSFTGIHSTHTLKSLPHLEGINDKNLLDKYFGNPEYWNERAIPKG